MATGSKVGVVLGFKISVLVFDQFPKNEVATIQKTAMTEKTERWYWSANYKKNRPLLQEYQRVSSAQ